MHKALLMVRNVAIGVALWATAGAALAIALFPFTNFVFNNPIGIDFHEETGQFAPGRLLLSVNFSDGLPHNLDLVAANGTPTQFTTLAGLTSEVKVATVRQSAFMQTFVVGEAFIGNGVPGQVARIAPDGLSFLNPWVALPGETALLRGSLFQDRFGAAGGDLIVVSGNEQEAGNSGGINSVGNVWRVSSTATANCSVGCTQLTNNILTHLEGVTTVANNPAIYGPMSATILAGAEEFDNTAGPPTYAAGGGKIYVVDPASTTSTNKWFTISAGLPNTCSLDINGKATPNNCNFQPVDGAGQPLATPFHPEDLDIIRRNSDFFGVAFSDGEILTASASDPDLVNRCGQVFITQEFPVAHHSGLFAMHWDPAQSKFVVDELGLAAVVGQNGGPVDSIAQWEHVTFTSGQDCTTTISIVKTPDGAKFNVGDAIFFDIVVKNTGNFDATDVTLNDPLPTTGGLTWAVTSVTPGPNSTCSIVPTQTLSCNFGTLAPGASQTVRVTITNAGGAPSAACTQNTLLNTGTAASSSATNSPVTDTGDYTCNPAALKVVKTPDNGTFTMGGQVTYTIVVSNPTGPNTAINATLSDQLPTNGGLTWTSVTTSQGTCQISPTYLLTCDFGDIPKGGSVTVTVKSPTSTPAAACTSQPNPAAIAKADNAPSVQDDGSQTCTPVNLVTVTQGGWGAPAHGNNPGTVLNAYFTAHPGYQPKIGDITNACSGPTLTFTSANAIRAFLPAGGPPSKLTSSATNPTTSAAGVFAGQVLALTLNTQVLSSGSALLNFVLTSGPATGKTVGTVLADANKALGGCGIPSYVTSISQLNDIVDTINNMFD